MSSSTILVVEDEAAIRDMLSLALGQAGFTVLQAEDSLIAGEVMKQRRPDLILLDWMLPGVSGVDWARRLKRDQHYREIPIILVTARSEESNKIHGLDSGADDYVTKPFSPRELIARIHAVLRRSVPVSDREIIEQDGIVLDVAEHQLTIDQKRVELSPTEFRLLAFFLNHPNKVYNRSRLLDKVWGYDSYIEERTVDVHIRRLRKALAEHGRAQLIETVRGFGYRFSPSSSDQEPVRE